MFTSFWHPNNKETNHSLEQISEDYEVEYNLSNRMYIIRPHIEDKGLFSGKIVVECKIDRQGKVLYTRAGVKGTTIPNSELYR